MNGIAFFAGSKTGKAWAQASYQLPKDNFIGRLEKRMGIARPRIAVVEIQTRDRAGNIMAAGSVRTSEKHADKILKGAQYLHDGYKKRPEVSAFKNAVSVVKQSNLTKGELIKRGVKYTAAVLTAPLTVPVAALGAIGAALYVTGAGLNGEQEERQAVEDVRGAVNWIKRKLGHEGPPAEPVSPAPSQTGSSSANSVAASETGDVNPQVPQPTRNEGIQRPPGHRPAPPPPKEQARPTPPIPERRPIAKQQPQIPNIPPPPKRPAPKPPPSAKS